MSEVFDDQQSRGGQQLKISVVHGILSALLSFVVFLILYFVKTNPVSGAPTWLGIWIPILFICLAIKKDRDENLGGYINYGRALGTGMLVTLTAATLYSVLIFLFGTYIGTDIVDTMKNETLLAMEKAKGILGEEMYDRALSDIANMNMAQIAFGDWQKTILGGFIVSLIAAGVFKKKRPMFESQENIN